MAIMTVRRVGEVSESRVMDHPLAVESWNPEGCDTCFVLSECRSKG